ncbi:MAG TPA: hypothetical protein VGR06_31865 [Actinophytocola sp.]|nr:hypothetical protein [Actinophytocola sp.]
MNAVKQFCRDEVRMPAFVFNSLEGDVTDVVAISEHPSDLTTRYGLDRLLTVRQRIESGVNHRLMETFYCVLISSEHLKREFDERTALLVYHDGSHFAVFVPLSHIEITDFSATGGSANTGLILHFPADNETIGIRAELINCRHDSVQELPRRSIVNVFRCRDHRNAGFSKF